MKKIIFLTICFVMLGASFDLCAEKKGHLTGVVNINEAGIEQLTMLPGIGLAKAKAIQEYVLAHPFQHVDELKNVKGIGDKALEILRPYIVVEGTSTATWEKPAIPITP